MNQVLSEEQREKRAREVYKRALWSAYFVGFAILVALEIVYFFVLHWLKIKLTSSPGWLAGFGAGMMFGVNWWGFNSVRRAGLLHEEHEIIVRAGAVATGETIEFYYPKSIWGKLSLIGFFLAIGVGAWWLWHYQGERFLGALGMLFSAGFILLSVRSFNLPNVRMDDEGILGYVIGSGLWPRLVRWDEIESVQFKRLWGLPAPPFKKDWGVETILLRNKAGKTPMVLGNNTFAGETPAWKQRFIAEIKRRLSGAN